MRFNLKQAISWSVPLRKAVRLIGGGFVAFLAGCVIPLVSHQEFPGIKVERENSPTVFIESARLQSSEGHIILSGSVMRRLGVRDTSGTFLRVRLLDANDQVLREVKIWFEPREIPRGPKMTGWSEFRSELGPLPPGTSQVKVLAVDGERDPG